MTTQNEAAGLASNESGLNSPNDEASLENSIKALEVERVSSLWSQLHALVDGKDCKLTELGGAHRLVFVHGDRLRFCPEWGKWLLWTGARWETAREPQIVHLAADITKRLGRIASDLIKTGTLTNDQLEFIGGVVEYAHSAERRAHLANVVALAQGLATQVKPDDLDADLWLLACPNGVIDLRTGALLPHDPSRLITKLAGVEYDPSATCPRWEACLAEIHPDPTVREYLRRAFGYALTGDVREHKFWIHQGGGRNGKGVTMNALRAVLGDYACVVPAKVLVATKSDRHPTEIAAIRGARLILASEAPQNAAYDETLIKSLTGGDPLTARRMREDFWTFSPTGKLHVQVNYDLTVHTDDPAFWARATKVPYTVSFLGREDRGLEDALRAELAGILVWCVRGCIAWQQRGLDDVPAAIVEATATYRREQDTLGAFLETCVAREPNAWTPRTELRRTYEAFCHEQGEPKPLHNKALCAELRRLGFSERKRNGAEGWSGARLIRTTAPGGRSLNIAPMINPSTAMRLAS